MLNSFHEEATKVFLATQEIYQTPQDSSNFKCIFFIFYLPLSPENCVNIAVPECSSIA